jgi:hypothetical protein
MFRILAFFCLAAFAACFATGRALAQTVPQGHGPVDNGSYVSKAAVAIWGEPKRDPRARTAIQMTQWVRRNPEQVSDADIAVLAGLLRHEDEIIRREAAGSLGFVGRRAASAAPALIEALREQPCSPQPAMPADAIRVALERIGAEPVNIPCTNPFGSP